MRDRVKEEGWDWEQRRWVEERKREERGEERKREEGTERERKRIP